MLPLHSSDSSSSAGNSEAARHRHPRSPDRHDQLNVTINNNSNTSSSIPQRAHASPLPLPVAASSTLSSVVSSADHYSSDADHDDDDDGDDDDTPLLAMEMATTPDTAYQHTDIPLRLADAKRHYKALLARMSRADMEAFEAHIVATAGKRPGGDGAGSAAAAGGNGGAVGSSDTAGAGGRKLVPHVDMPLWQDVRGRFWLLATLMMLQSASSFILEYFSSLIQV